MMQVEMPNIKLEQAMAMILPHCALGFFPGMESFVNHGALMNGSLICDCLCYTWVIDEINQQIMKLLQISEWDLML